MEQGFTPIANEILEAVSGASLNGTQLRILLLLWRNSYGFHKKECALPLSYLAKKLRGNKSTIAKEVRKLLAMGVVSARLEKSDGHTPKKYTFCKDYTLWKCGAGEAESPILQERNGKGREGKGADCERVYVPTEKDNKKYKYKHNYKFMQNEKKSRYDYDEIMRKTFLNVTNQKGDNKL